MNCLNFGNPEHPEVMWQFAEVVDGMSDACRALGIPVVGGNVSFYNESRGARHRPHPGGRGGRADRRARPPCRRRAELRDGDALVVLGAHRARARRVGMGPPPRSARRVTAGRRSRRPPSRCTTSCATWSPRRVVRGRARRLRRRPRGHPGRDGGRRRVRVPRRVARPSWSRRWPGSRSRRPGSSSPSIPPVPTLSSSGPGRPTSPPNASAPPAVTASWPTAPSRSRSPTPPTPGATPSRPPSAGRRPTGSIGRESTPWNGG